MQQKYLNRSTLEATLGVFFDSFIKIMIAITVFLGVFGFPINTVYTEILPSFGISIFITQLFLLFLCFYIKKTTPNVIPLPAGISSDRFFIWIFAIMLPTYNTSNNLSLTIAVGVGANFLSSILSMFLALLSNLVLKFIPTPALFATLSGASLAWLILSPLKEAFNNPIIAFVCFFIVIISHIGNFKTKFSPILLSIITGIIISFSLNPSYLLNINIAEFNLGFYFPNIFFSNIIIGIKEAYKFIPIILGITIIELITNIQAVEQAKKVGVNYNTKFSIFFVHFISMLSSFIGNPFTISLLWGYSTWYKMKTSKYYSLSVGFLFLAVCLTGFSAIIMTIIPVASIIPIIVFIGIISISESFKISQEKYYLPMIIGLVFPMMDFLKVNIGDNIPISLSFLAQGATLISLLWVSILVFLVDKKYLHIAISFALGGIFSFVGLIHGKEIKLFYDTKFSLLYIIFSILFLLLHLFNRYNKENIK